MFKLVSACLAAFAATTAAHAQPAAATPIKAGLWETTITTSMQMQLPPDLQARLDAMTPQQQAMVKANMPNMGGGTPSTITTHSCSTGQTSANDLINQAQQKAGAKCTVANQTQTANGVSFDISCTTPQGTASGHSSYTMADPEHLSGSTHMTAQITTQRGQSSMALDSALSAKYVGADCGSVQPNSSVAVTK